MPPPPADAATADVATDAAGHYMQHCASCHGKTAEGVGDFPSLAKLDRATIDARLRAYRAGETVGPKSAVMAPMAKTLSDEQITALATYLGS
jgi:cytochrome c553